MSGLRVSGRASSRPPGLQIRSAVSDSEHAVPPGASRCCSSWCRDASRFRRLRLNPASHFSLDEESSLRSLRDGPEPRRRSFDLGLSILVDGPVRRVMSFPCLTAGDIRFLVPPLPAGDVGLPYGWLTAEARQTLSGELGSRICEMRAGWVPSQLAGRFGVLTCRGIACMPSSRGFGPFTVLPTSSSLLSTFR